MMLEKCAPLLSLCDAKSAAFLDAGYISSTPSASEETRMATAIYRGVGNGRAGEDSCPQDPAFEATEVYC